MSWLDKYFKGTLLVKSSGVPLPVRAVLDYVGVLEAVDDPVTGETKIQVTGALAALLGWLIVDSTGAKFISTISAPTVGITAIKGTGSNTGTPILYTGQSVGTGEGGEVLEGTKGGALFVAGARGGEGGDTVISGGDSETTTGKGGDLTLQGGGFSSRTGAPVTPASGSRGGSVILNASTATTTVGKVKLQVGGTDRIRVETADLYIGAGNAAHVHGDVSAYYSLAIGGVERVSIAAAAFAVSGVAAETHDVDAAGTYAWTIGGALGMQFAPDGFRVAWVDGSELPLLQALGGGGLIADSDATKLQWTAGGETALFGTGVRVEGGSTGITFDGGTKARLDANGFSADYNGDTKNLSADVNGVTCTASAYTLVPSLATITRTTQASGKIEVDFTVNGVPVTTACQLAVFVDGVITSPPIQGQLGLGLGVITSSMKGLITGLSAAAHTVDLRYKNGAGGTLFIRPGGTSGATGEQACLDAKVVSA